MENTSQPSIASQNLDSSVEVETALSNTPKLKKTILVVAAMFLLVIVGAAGYYLGSRKAQSSELPHATQPQPSSIPDEGVVCTMDALICPDGSAVGRSGPNCEFAQCPSSAENAKQNRWQVFQSDHYPYSVSYPSDFTYRKLDAGRAEYQGYIEHSRFERNTQAPNQLKSFRFYITTPQENSPYQVPENIIFDQQPTGKFELNNQSVNYLELPQGYADGASASRPPSPEVALQFYRNGSLYLIVFEGVSSITDKSLVEILNSVSFQN